MRHDFEARSLPRLLAALVAALPSMSLILSRPFTRLRAGCGAAGEIIPNDPTSDSDFGACNHLVTWTFAVVFLLAATCAFGQEQERSQAKSVSPDGKWELRAGAAGEQEDFVIAKAGSDETSLVLSEEEYVNGLAEALGRTPGYANIIWTPDSKRFAYNLQPGKGFQTAQFYQLYGNTWRKLDSIESNAAMAPLVERSLTRQKKMLKKELKLPADDWGWPLLTSWQVRRWIDSSTALVYARRSAKFELKNETQEVNVSFFFTLKFDSAGHWKVVRTHEVVPTDGGGGLNKVEQEEAKRIEETQK